MQLIKKNPEERVKRKDGGRNTRNKGIWMDRGRERQIINETGRRWGSKGGTEADGPGGERMNAVRKS